MTKLLLRLFIKEPINPDSPKIRSALGRLSGLVGIVCNVLLFFGELAVGLLTGSLSITADAMNNLSDASSSIVTLIVFKLAEKPADEDHPYGHARFEYLSGLAVAAMIIVIGFELGKSSVGKIFNPEAVQFNLVAGVVLVASMVVKLWLSLFNGRLGRQINSTVLMATAADSRNDVITTAAVLAAALVEYFTEWQIDGYMGLAVAAFILYSGANLAKETISPLLGEAASPELRQLIVDEISQTPEVLGYHDLMVHDYGPGQRFASIHVEMDKRKDPLLCHTIIDDLERECLKSHGIHLVIHYDPVVMDDEELTRLHNVVDEILRQEDPRLKTHDFRMACSTGHTNLIFDVALPSNLFPDRKAIKQRLDQQLNEREEKTYYTVITFDLAAFNLEDEWD